MGTRGTPGTPGTAVRIGSLWYLVVPVLSVGLFTFLPFVHAAVRLRRAVLWLPVLVFALISAGVIVVSGQPEGSVPGLVDGLLVVGVLGAMVGGTAYLTGLRREVYGLAEPRVGYRPPVAVPVADDPAVALVLAARDRRARAREIVATDPLMARDLRIGRPDLPRAYDDGGLVDIVTAPVAVIAEVCGLSTEQATAIRSVRESVLAVDDLFSLLDLPLSTWDRVRDRAVLLG